MVKCVATKPKGSKVKTGRGHTACCGGRSRSSEAMPI